MAVDFAAAPTWNTSDRCPCRVAAVKRLIVDLGQSPFRVLPLFSCSFVINQRVAISALHSLLQQFHLVIVVNDHKSPVSFAVESTRTNSQYFDFDSVTVRLFPIDSTIQLAAVRCDQSAIIQSDSFLCARAPKENTVEIELITNGAKLDLTLRNIA